MRPKASIIIPCSNVENSVADAVESILNQTYKNFELLLIENSSASNRNLVLTELAFKDSRIRLIDSAGQGLAHQLNAGIEAARAPFIAFMDSRDISLPNRIEKQINYLEKNKTTDLVSSLIQLKQNKLQNDEDDSVFQYINWLNRIITHDDISINRFIESPLVLSTWMFRNNLTNNFGIFNSGEYPTDFEMLLRWLANGVHMFKMSEVLVHWEYSVNRFIDEPIRYSDQGIFEIKSRYMFDWLKKNNSFFPEVAVWGAGRSSRHRFYILHELGIHAKFYIDINANPERKVIQFQQTPPAGQNFILCYVSNRLAREKIRIFLVELGYTEGNDFICMA